MKPIYYLLLLILSEMTPSTVFAAHCSPTLGISTNMQCSVGGAGSMNNTFTIPNNVSIGQTLYQDRPSTHPTMNINNAGESDPNYTAWAIVSGSSLDNVCPGADATMFSTGEGSCLMALQILDVNTGQPVKSDTPLSAMNDQMPSYTSINNKFTYIQYKVIYLGSGLQPTNMPLPPDLFLIDSISQQQSGTLLPGGNIHINVNMQTCSGGGTSITLDPAVPTVDIGSVFGTSKQLSYHVQCPKMVADNYDIQTTFSGPALDGGYTGFGKSSGSAEGVGFQLKVNNTVVGDGSVITNIPVDANGLAQLNFDISYIKIAPIVTPGNITSTVTISYLYQ